MNSAQKFQEKYGLSATKFIDDLNVKFLGLIKTIGLQTLIDTEISKITDEKIVVNNEFYKLLVEAMAEEGEKFPQNQKVTLDDGTILEIPSVQPSMPTSKGLLEDFKNMVSTDELRPAMTGVYVSEDNYLVGTNAHVLVKFYGSNKFTNNHKGKIIDLKNYLASKGRRIDDVDQKYPNYDVVIPKDNSIKKTISLYALYNLAKSAVATSKLIDNNPFVLHLSIEGNEFYVSPVLLADLCAFWLAKGKQSTEVQFGSPTRAILFVFDSEDVGLLMPCMGREDIIKSKLYSLEQVDKEFDGGKAKAKAAKKAPIPKKSEGERKEAFKKFEGDIKSDSEYISRREIDRVILKNGDVLYTNDIVDGIYKVKGKKMSLGGVAQSYGSPMIESGMQSVTGNWGGSPVSVFEKGGKIKNQYEGKSPKQVYEMWHYGQKYEFFKDHFHNKGIYSDSEYKRLPSKKYDELDQESLNALNTHIKDGQYSGGGKIKGDPLESVRKDAKQISKNRKGNFYIFQNQYTDLSSGDNYVQYTWGEEEDVNHMKGISHKINGLNSVKILGRYKNGELVSSEQELLYKNDVEESQYAKGGKIGFEGLAKKVAKRYSGKKVDSKYQDEYGKEYDSKEAKEVGRKVAAKVYRQQQGKMANGGEVGQEIEFEFSYIDSGSPLKQRAKILSKNGDYYKVKVINGIMKGQTTEVHKSLIVKKMADGGFVGDLAGSDLTPTMMGGGLGNVQDSIMAKGGRTKVYAIKKIKK